MAGITLTVHRMLTALCDGQTRLSVSGTDVRLALIHRFTASELVPRCARSGSGAEDRRARIRRMRN